MTGRGTKLPAVYGPSAIILAAILVALFTPDRDARRVLKANCLARDGKWKELLAEIDRHPRQAYPASVMMDVNRALYETGRLGDRMFFYLQTPDLLFELGAKATSFKGACDLLLRLGCVNEAEHVALEALEIKGERPETLRRLATICIVKGRPGAARILLGALTRDIIHGERARDTLRRLDADPLLSKDPEIRRLKSVMLESDMVVTSKAKHVKETLLLSLLARNPSNRMAREYLLAHYLLTRQPSKVACTLSRPQTSHDRTTPPHYAEALLLHGHRFGGNTVPGVARVPEHTAAIVRGAIQTVSEYRADRTAIANALESRFPGSYCRYFFAGQPGGKSE